MRSWPIVALALHNHGVVCIQVARCSGTVASYWQIGTWIYHNRRWSFRTEARALST